MDTTTILRLIDLAFRGDMKAQRQLAELVIEIIDREVRNLLHQRYPTHARIHADDLTYAIVLWLYESHGRLIRGWQPQRGMSFPSYLSFIGRRQIRRWLSQFRNNPAALTPTEDEQLERYQIGPDPELERDLEIELAYTQLARFLDTQCSEIDRRRFRALYVEEVPVCVLADREGVSRAAIDTWKKRLRDRLREGLPDVVAVLEGPRTLRKVAGPKKNVRETEALAHSAATSYSTPSSTTPRMRDDHLATVGVLRDEPSRGRHSPPEPGSLGSRKGSRPGSGGRSRHGRGHPSHASAAQGGLGRRADGWDAGPDDDDGGPGP